MEWGRIRELQGADFRGPDAGGKEEADGEGCKVDMAGV